MEESVQVGLVFILYITKVCDYKTFLFYCYCHRSILGERELRYSPITSAKIINGTAVCHNFLKSRGFVDEFNDINVAHTTVDVVENAARTEHYNLGRAVRQNILNLLN